VVSCSNFTLHNNVLPCQSVCEYFLLTLFVSIFKLAKVRATKKVDLWRGSKVLLFLSHGKGFRFFCHEGDPGAAHGRSRTRDISGDAKLFVVCGATERRPFAVGSQFSDQ
jgi:hypothetical protein